MLALQYKHLVCSKTNFIYDTKIFPLPSASCHHYTASLYLRQALYKLKLMKQALGQIYRSKIVQSLPVYKGQFGKRMFIHVLGSMPTLTTNHCLHLSLCVWASGPIRFNLQQQQLQQNYLPGLLKLWVVGLLIAMNVIYKFLHQHY